MFTTLFFRRGIQTPLMEEIESVCASIYGTRASHAAFGSGSYVHYAPDGVSYETSRRLSQIPVEMQAYPPHKVMLKMIERDLDLPTGIFTLGSAVLISESSIHSSPTIEPYVVHSIVAEGPTLDEVNALMDDFLRHGTVGCTRIARVTASRKLRDVVDSVKQSVSRLARRVR